MEDNRKLFLGQNFMVFKTVGHYGITARLQLRIVEVVIREFEDSLMGPKVLQ